MRKLPSIFTLAICVVLFGACGVVTVHHVPRGQSLNVALAKKAEAVHVTPAASAPSKPASEEGAGHSEGADPELPTKDTERISELMTHANLCMQTGQIPDAIVAYEEVVRKMPSLADARYNLAVLYQLTGREKDALDQFRHYKALAEH